MISAMTKNITSERAFDVIKAGGITRLMKAYNYHSPSYQHLLADLMEAIIVKGQDYTDIPTVISMTLCPYPAL